MTMSINNTTNANHTGCDAANFIAVIGWIVWGIGMVGNLQLLYFVVQKLTPGRRNDNVFLLNIIAADFFSLFGSLLPEMLGRGGTFSYAMDYCIWFHVVNFVSLFTNLTSMAALCYDRYENVTKFPAERKLSFGKSLQIVIVGWVLPVVLVTSAESGFLVANPQGQSICKAERSRAPVASEIGGFLALIVLVSIWITFHVTIINLFLSGIYSRLMRHRQEAEQILGIKRTLKEINLQKQQLAIVTCYSACWIPFGIAAGLAAADVIGFYSCLYFGCLVGAHGSAATTPLIYLTVDKRFRFKFRVNRRRKQGHRPAPTIVP